MKQLRFGSFFVLIFIGVLLGNGVAQTDAGFGSFGIKEFAFEVGPGSIFSPDEEILVVDSPKAKPRRIAGTSAVWSPDGRKIAYCAHEGWGTPRIVLGQMQLVEVDGSGHRQLTNLQGGACPMDWSPDGQKIAFGGGLSRGILVLSEDRESVTRILPGIAGLWSPDGSKLVFWKYRESRQSSGSIWLADGDGKNPRKVLDDNSEVVGLCWSPDGKSILFSSDRQQHGKWEIFRVNLDGSSLETFATDKKMSLSFPVISPDSRYLVVGAHPANGSGESTIFLIDLTSHSGTSLAHGTHPHIVWEKP